MADLSFRNVHSRLHSLLTLALDSIVALQKKKVSFFADADKHDGPSCLKLRNLTPHWPYIGLEPSSGWHSLLLSTFRASLPLCTCLKPQHHDSSPVGRVVV